MTVFGYSNADAQIGGGAGAPREPIAIIGIGCRFPGGIADPDAFWRCVRDGVDAVGQVPADRRDGMRLSLDGAAVPAHGGHGGFLTGIDRFDAAFFGMAPREAARLDPQQRLLLEVAYEALEDAGLPLDRLAGSRTGVFIGLWLGDFEARMFRDPAQVDLYMTTGSGRYAAAGRLSYAFGLEGPSLVVDTACSSSLVAIHLACRSLWSGETSLALAGGANVILQPSITHAYGQSGMLAADGRCKFGDARADGYVRSEGAGIVVLRPLAQALAAGDPIYALILGGAVNSDGRGNGHIVAPASSGQAALLWQAYADAAVPPGTVGYVEAHGTGTAIGDRVELGALGAGLAEGRGADTTCAIGSVKTNIGHTEGAAGVAGLIKTALVLRHRLIPPNLHFETPSPEVAWADLPIYIPRAATPLPATGRIVAGVNGFGITGTNAHLVLATAPEPAAADATDPSDGRRTWLVPLSAHSPAALRERARDLARLLRENAPQFAGGQAGSHAGDQGSGAGVARFEIAHLAYTAAVRRTHHAHRLAETASGAAELCTKLDTAVARLDRVGRAGDAARSGTWAARGADGIDTPPKVVFVFPGQGGQWVGMGRALLDEAPEFRTAIERCETALRPWVDWSLVEQLGLAADAPGYRLDRIEVIQPALVAIGIALSEQLAAWGIRPDAVIGHSLGEVAAARVAGALTLEDAMRVIALRSRLMQRLSGQGAMAMVELGAAETEAALSDLGARAGVAVVNGPRATVVSGEPEAIDALVATLNARDVFARRIQVDVAAHGPQVAPLLPELRASLVDLRPEPAAIPIYSTALADVVGGEVLDADYWVRNLGQPVRFGPMVQRLLDEGFTAFVELGPHPVLAPVVREAIEARGIGAIAVAAMRRDEHGLGIPLEALGALYVQGASVHWDAICPARCCVPLPPYPWQRERHWYEPVSVGLPVVDAGPRAPASSPGAPLGDGAPGNRTPVGQGSEAEAAAVDPQSYSVDWVPMPAVADLGGARPASRGTWILLADAGGLGLRLAERLRGVGETVVFAVPGEDTDAGSGEVVGGRAGATEAAGRVAGGHPVATDGGGPRPAHAQLHAIPLTEPEAFRRLVQGALTTGMPPLRGVVHLWGLDEPALDVDAANGRRDDAAPSAEAVMAAQARGCLAGLHLAQALLAATDAPPRLWFVTLGAQPVGDPAEERPGWAGLAHAPLWGMAAVIAQEHPELQCTCVDLADASEAGGDDPLWTELWIDDDERQIAWRAEERYAARLRRSELAMAAAVETALPGQAYRLRIDQPGRLDNLCVVPDERRRPGRGEVEIEVGAAGLNFLDVMKAMGIYPGLEPGAVGALGAECAGRVTAVGAEVADLQVGDAVIAISPRLEAVGLAGRYATLPALLVAPRPEGVAFDTAATLPVAFLTAWLALRHLARVEPGERVLIHSAAGGVGLAAVQIARSAGAEVLATAGSPAKRAYLRRLGIRSVFDSRSLDFAEGLREATGGRGVDVVLNTLTGAAMRASLGLLVPGGRFVEIGKRDIYADAPIGLAALRENRSYLALDLAALIATRPAQVRRWLDDILDQVRAGTIEPLPVTGFDIGDAEAAFRRMSQAQHIGRIALRLDGPPPTLTLAPGRVRSEATYLITGGLGGLGLAVAGWLVRQGARHLVLVGRRPPSEAVQAAVEALAAAGAEVVVRSADVSEASALAAVIEAIDRDMPPLAGVVHAAGVLADGTIERLDGARFRYALAPKLAGAWNLDRLTTGRALDFFVLFGSAVTVLGSPGQANYAAANAFLGALAHHRRARGLPALCIDWGPWRGIGLAAARTERGARLAVRGLDGLAPEGALQALARALGADATRTVVMAFDAERWCESLPAAASWPVLADLRSGGPPAPAGRDQALELRAALAAADPGRPRRALVEAHLVAQVSHVLGLAPERLPLDAPLKAVGLDSLMTLELRHRLENSLGLRLPATYVWNHPTVTALTAFLVDRIDVGFEPGRPAREAAIERPVTPAEGFESAAVPAMAGDDGLAAVRDQLADELADVEAWLERP